METQIRTAVGAFRTTPGGVLVVLGFMTIYVLTGVRGDRDPDIISYSGIGFGFLVTMAGIILLFRGLAQSSEELTEENALSSSDIEHALAQLGKNYDILRRQATQGFVLAGTFMALGILVILAGSIGEMFGFTKTAGNLTVVAGVVIEVVSGLGLYLFKETFQRLNSTSDRLYEMWKLLAAFRKADELPEDKKSDVVITLINVLVGLRAIEVLPVDSTSDSHADQTDS